jgi:hypothetical protein
MKRALLALALVGCAPPPLPPATASLRMRGAPADANVTIDDEPIGTLGYVAQRGVALPKGQHRVTVEAPGHFPYDKLVEAKEGGQRIDLEVKLQKIPD